MIDLALDPSETRPGAAAKRSLGADRPWGRIAVFSVLALAGTGAFASVAGTYFAGLAGPQRAATATRQKAADWPDLKDGLPALASGSLPAVPKVREILPSEPARPPISEARAEPAVGTTPAAGPDVAALPPASAPRASETKSVAPAKPLPAVVEVPVIGPPRQANLVAPPRTVAGLAPLGTETVRAKSVGADAAGATFAALPPETAKATAIRREPARSEPTRPEAARPETGKAKPRIEAHAKPPAAEKPAAERTAPRKAAAVEAKAAPAETQDEDTEVFGIKVPSLAPAGRKLRESVEALGDAVKGIPDRF